MFIKYVLEYQPTYAQQQKSQLPYRQSYKFNGFGNLTERNNLHWGVENWGNQANNLSYTYENNKITNSGWQYDADGRATQAVESNNYTQSTFDVKGQMTNMITDGTSKRNRFYDGNGREAKRTGEDWVEDEQGENGSWVAEPTKYFIRSSVLGNEVVSETDALGRKAKTYVRAAGATLAWQTVAYNLTTQAETEYVNFEHWDVSGLSYRSTANDGTQITGEGAEGSPAELDPLGSNVGLYTPYWELIQPPPPEPEYPTLQPMNTDMPMMVNGQQVTCTLDGFAIGCEQAQSMRQNGVAIQAPSQMVAGIWSNSQQRYVGLAIWNPQAAQAGIAFLGSNSTGFLPVGVNYSSGGFSGSNVTQWFTAGGLNQLNRNFLPIAAFDEVYGRQPQSQQTLPTPLSGQALRKWQTERDRLQTLLFRKEKLKTSCLRFLEEALGEVGFDVNKLSQDLMNQTPYDFEKSTNPDTTLAIFDNTKAAADALKAANRDLPDAYTSSSTNNIYYTSTGLKLSIILHESLHRVFGLSDQTLAEKLKAIGKGVRVNDEKKNPKGSRVINQALEDAGCK